MRIKPLRYLLLVFIIVISDSSFICAKVSPSFDCTKATTEVEKLICSDDELAKLDVEMNKSYHAFMKTLDEKYYRNKLKKKQREWLKYRENLICFNTNNTKKITCLKNAYQRRNKNFQDWASRQNYDFFIDYADLFEQQKKIGYGKVMGKFISQLGDEYYIDCKRNIIIPRRPEEKIYFDNIRGPLPYNNSYVEINHSTEDFIYFRCNGFRKIDETQSLNKFSLDMIKTAAGQLKVYPKDEDDMDSIIKFIKDVSTQNNYVKLIELTSNKKALSSEKCMELWSKLKNNNFEVVPYVMANSQFELKEKENINCSHDQFYKIAPNKYNGYDIYVPPFRVYTIGEKKYLLGHEVTTTNRICQIDMNKCYCTESISTLNFQEGILLKIQGQFYFAKYNVFMGSFLSLTQFSDKTIKENYLRTSCLFKFMNNKGD